MIDAHDLYMSAQLPRALWTMSGVHFVVVVHFDFIFMYDLGQHAPREKKD